jgi:COP9 signalosome complex subunit 1
MAHQDIGQYYEGVGSLREASEAYNSMRPDVGSPHHLVDVGKHLVSVAIQLREWSVVIGHLVKMTTLQAGSEEKNVIPFVKITRGIALMGLENYADAAQCFLSVDAATPATDYNEYAAPNDIAVYGVLLSLATLDRQKLQKQVLENQNFRTFLELEPHLRKAVSLFVNGRYTACLSILESHRSDYRLDLYLRKHVADIFKLIRTKCIVQFFIPYSCVTLDSMIAAFSRPGEDFEAELRELILSHELNARINEVDRVSTSQSLLSCKSRTR